jgi:hypothetical protein
VIAIDKRTGIDWIAMEPSPRPEFIEAMFQQGG